MITQTIAILVDAYRELNSKKMFWITLIISGAVMGAFALLGATPTGLKVLKWELPMSQPLYVYKQMFSWVVFWAWLTIAASLLGMISTAGIFPNLIEGGSIALFVSKPLGRLRLFLTKYVAGLLFMVLQVSIFATASFIVLGLRASVWEPRIFVAIPIVACFFSYLYAVSVFAGVLTRSTVAAILVTVIFWFLLGVLNYSEGQAYSSAATHRQYAMYLDRKIKIEERQIQRLEATTAPTTRDSSEIVRLRKSVTDSAEGRDMQQAMARSAISIHRFLYRVKTFLPKSGETTNMLDTILIEDREIAANTEEKKATAAEGNPFFHVDPELMKAAFDADLDKQREMRGRSFAWIVGTSLGFELCVLALAAWIFCRRDY